MVKNVFLKSRNHSKQAKLPEVENGLAAQNFEVTIVSVASSAVAIAAYLIQGSQGQVGWTH